MRCTKLKAGALQITLGVIMVTALLLMSIILLNHLHRRFKFQSQVLINNMQYNQEAIRYGLVQSIRHADTLDLQGMNFGAEILKLHSAQWGLFEKYYTYSKSKNYESKAMCLVGAKQSKNPTSLYLQDNGKPLVLVGNTKIEGTSYIPERGVKSGNIGGVSYYGSQLIYGPQKRATTLPKLESKVLDYIQDLEEIIHQIPKDQLLDAEQRAKHNNSFYNPIQLLYAVHPLDLADICLTGNIMVYSKSKIIINSSSVLKDVILVAPEIEIKDKVEGRFQAIASKNILVGKGVKLEYPSAIMVSEDKLIQHNQNDKTHLPITIKENTQIKGLVVYLGKTKPNNYKPQILIKSKAFIMGEVYCNQNTSLRGIISGTLWTNNLVVEEGGALYQNHIYDGKISNRELPLEYVGLPFKNSKKSIVQWLY